MLSSILTFQCKRDIELAADGHHKDFKHMHVAYKDRLREECLFSLEGRGVRLLEVESKRMRHYILKLSQGKFSLDLMKKVFIKSG